jgi:hypothetical protein
MLVYKYVPAYVERDNRVRLGRDCCVEYYITCTLNNKSRF